MYKYAKTLKFIVKTPKTRKNDPQNQPKIDPESVQNGNLAQNCIFNDFGIDFGPHFEPILGPLWSEKLHQKHIQKTRIQIHRTLCDFATLRISFWMFFGIKITFFQLFFSHSL